ncbi:hypothetical protein Pan97_11680 [Bremerella volcania]|uniref:Uncharacterized protein n=1 Tax=Bremerella volcania TaxID=2527984 RepID=A0A518C4L0_9BACT|nr:hypothetical protein Pan97_11680 [Bremerella volcania]
MRFHHALIRFAHTLSKSGQIRLRRQHIPLARGGNYEIGRKITLYIQGNGDCLSVEDMTL